MTMRCRFCKEAWTRESLSCTLCVSAWPASIDKETSAIALERFVPRSGLLCRKRPAVIYLSRNGICIPFRLIPESWFSHKPTPPSRGTTQEAEKKIGGRNARVMSRVSCECGTRAETMFLSPPNQAVVDESHDFHMCRRMSAARTPRL